MATATGNYVHDNSSLANFKNWAMPISQALAAFGWIQTADSGQVNWSSIASVPNNAYVYEVWKANDAQAATLPIFLRLEYGYHATTVRIRATVGTGSDGAGNITGVVTNAPWQLTYTESNNGATIYPCYFSGDAGEFRMYLWQTQSAWTGTIFIIERAKDSLGSKTAEYFTALNMMSGGYCQYKQQTVFSATLLAPLLWTSGNTNALPAAVTTGISTGTWNGKTSAFPCFPVYGQVGNPFLGLVVVHLGDTADGALVTVASMYGATHSYVVAKGNAFNTVCASGNFCAAMRYE